MSTLATRLREAAEVLAGDIPAWVREVPNLEGDVNLDELDLYCVRLMEEAAAALEHLPRDPVTRRPVI